MKLTYIIPKSIYKKPYVTIDKHGKMMLSRQAVQNMELTFEDHIRIATDGKHIFIKKASKTDIDKFSIKKTGQSLYINVQNNLSDLNIALGKKYRFVLRDMNNGLFKLDMASENN